MVLILIYPIVSAQSYIHFAKIGNDSAVTILKSDFKILLNSTNELIYCREFKDSLQNSIKLYIVNTDKLKLKYADLENKQDELFKSTSLKLDSCNEQAVKRITDLQNELNKKKLFSNAKTYIIVGLVAGVLSYYFIK